MNGLPQLIKRIIDFLNSADLTNSGASQAMAEEYVKYCREFNERIEQCRIYSERKMHIEALKYAESQRPPLDQQDKLLCFGEREKFLELFVMYDWEKPPRLQREILRELYAVSQEKKNFDPLLNAYRKLARSEDLEGKIYLLRKIAVLDAANKEWKETLRNLETQQLEILTEQAKKAIIGQDYPKIESIWAELSSANWTVAPNALVLSKISRVLEDHRIDELHKLSLSYLEEINNAYSAFDIKALSAALRKWHHLVQVEGFNPDASAVRQVNEAEEYLRGQEKIIAEEEKFNNLIGKLRDAVGNEYPLGAVEQLYHQATMFGREIPEAVIKRYQSYKDNVESLQRRRTFLKVSGITVGALAVISLVFVFSYRIITNNKAMEWEKRLKTSLDNDSTGITFKLFEELEKNAPKIRQRNNITRMYAKLEEKKKAEDEKRKKFQEIAERMKSELNDFEKNENTIALDRVQIAKNIVDLQEKTVYEELEREFKLRQEEYFQRQDRKYIALIARIRDLRKEFFGALETEQLEKAQKILELSEQIQAEAHGIKNVSSTTRSNNQRYLDAIGELKVRLMVEKKRNESRGTKMYEIKTSNTLAALNNEVGKFVREFPDDPRAAEYRKFWDSQIKHALDFAAIVPQEALQGNIFYRDANALKELNSQSSAILSSAATQLEKLVQNNAKNPLYAIILKNPHEKILYDFYYYDRVNAEQLLEGDLCNWQQKVFADEQGNMKDLKLLFVPGNHENFQIILGGKTSTANLLFPKEFRFRGTENRQLAPHVKILQEIQEAVKAANDANIEETLIKAFYDIAGHPLINPYIRVQLSKLVLGFVLDKSEYAKLSSYEKVSEYLNGVQKKVPEGFNWMNSYENGANVQKTLQDDLMEIPSFFQLTAARDFYRYLYGVALNRKVKLVGFIEKDEGKPVFYPFHNSPRSGEIWLLSDDHNRFTYSGEYILSEATAAPGVKFDKICLVYSPEDNKSTRELMKEVKKEAEKYRLEINWPVSWPVFGEEEAK